MRRLRKKFASFSLLLAWLCANGALWDTVQVFAWAKMFAGFTATMSPVAAAQATFDPAKSCPLCHEVAKAKDTARQQLPATTERAAEKFLLALPEPAALTFTPPPVTWPTPLASVAPSRTEAVPVPPPRV